MESLKYPIILTTPKSELTSKVFVPLDRDKKYLSQNCVNNTETPQKNEIAQRDSMDFIIFLGEEHDLSQCEQCGKQSMVSKKEVI